MQLLFAEQQVSLLPLHTRNIWNVLNMQLRKQQNGYRSLREPVPTVQIQQSICPQRQKNTVRTAYYW